MTAKVDTPRPWIRLYTEFATDPIIQALSFEDQRHYVQILLMKGGAILDRRLEPDVRERIIRKTIGLEPEYAEAAKSRLISIGLIDKNWHPLAWDKRQFEGDYSTERVQKYRKNKKKLETVGNVSETLHKRFRNAPETDTETDTENRCNTHLPAKPNLYLSPTLKEEKEVRIIGGQSSATNEGQQADDTCVKKSEGYDQDFLQCWKIYPARTGGNPKQAAYNAWKARRKGGATVEELYEGTVRYAEFCRAMGQAGSQYVKMASTFYGPSLHFQEDWVPAKNGNGNGGGNGKSPTSLTERAQALVDHFANKSRIIDGECHETH